MHKLTLTSLNKNATRTIVSVIGIILSIALITVVASMMASVQQTIINNAIKYSGDYDVMMSGQFPDSFYKKLDSSPSVRDAFFSRNIGQAKFDNSMSEFTDTVIIQGFDAKTYSSGFDFELKEGKLPSKSDEVVLSKTFVGLSSKEYHAGDKINFSIGYYDIKQDESDPTGENTIIEFVTQKTVTYTVSGILSDFYSSFISNNIGMASVYTYIDEAEKYKRVEGVSDAVFVRFTDSAEKNYRRETAELIGADPDTVDIYLNNPYDITSQTYYEKIKRQAHTNGIEMESLDKNSSVLQAKNIDLDAERTVIMVLLVCFLFVIIIGASVFIIRNSFAISITEKTKLYGMLSSMGATSKQIRSNVFFEGFLLGLAGIPLGIILGIGTTAGLIVICNGLMREFMNGTELAFSVPFIVIIGALFLGAITIFFSVYDAAVRASKISPIVAIRSNEDINISKRKKGKAKSYRTPKLVSGLFGAGGIIAWKNMKRSRRQYRATVVSIVLSVAIFISINSFMDYNITYIRESFESSPYNVGITVWFNDMEDRKDIISDCKSAYSKIAAFSSVDKYVYYNIGDFGSSKISFPLSVVTDDMKNSAQANIKTDKNTFEADFNIYAVNDEFFAELAKKCGMTFEECKGKAFIKNNIKVYENEGVVNRYRSAEIDNGRDRISFRRVNLLKNDANATASCELVTIYNRYYENEYDHTEEEAAELLKNNTKHLSLDIAGSIYDDIYLREYGYLDNGVALYMRLDDYDTMVINGDENVSKNVVLSLHVTDQTKFEKELSDLKSELTNTEFYVSDTITTARIANAILVIAEIFAYGFIIVISLIGLTNIFNTITTNMRMRRKEFAVLQSIGMTKKEFNRMIALESLLYTMKSLIIGIPIGLLGSWGIYSIYGSQLRGTAKDMPFLFPTFGILISIFTVLILVWIIMRFSIRKVRTQNIIETIRSEN